jgi:peptidoglycan/xylan/chitin deacetylase (PgdA/CDA1 family)
MAPYRFLSGFVAVAAVTAFVHCSNKSSAVGSEGRPCSGTQALQSTGLRGTSMEPKTLALTFDDGPGQRTKQLSRFLKSEGIEAVFFVNGARMDGNSAEILQALIDDGHLVANHTETHQSLTGTSTAMPRLGDSEVVKEVADTDAKIEPFVPSKRFLFRPPFGDFDNETLAALSATPMNKYVGPILWDVGEQMDEGKGRAADWDCFDDGNDGKRISMKACGDLYITEIKRAGRGIVLLHDPVFDNRHPEQLGTVDMVMYMVPILKEQGFSFLRVDKIPEIDALLPPLPAAVGDGGAQGGPDKPDSVSPNDPCR